MSRRWIQSVQTIPLYEVHNTRKLNLYNTGGGAPTASVKLACRYDDIDLAIQELLGAPDVNRWPYLTTPLNLYPTSVVVTPDGGQFEATDEELTAYDYYFLDVSYASRLGVYFQTGGTQPLLFYIEDKQVHRAEMQPLTNTTFVWDSAPNDPVARDQVPRIPIPGHSLMHMVSGYLEINLTTWDNLQGTTNSVDYTSPNLGDVYEAKTLMLRSYEIVSEWTHNSFRDPNNGGTNSHTYTVIFHYEYKPLTNRDQSYGWDHFLRFKAGAANAWEYDKMKTQDTADPFLPFPAKDHSSILFQ